MDIYNQPLSKDERKSISLSALFALLGYLIALFTCCDVFARFGALVVCTGVYFGAKGFSLRSNKITAIAEKIWEEDIQKILSAFESKKSDTPKEFVEKAKAQFSGKSKELEAKKNRSVYALEMRWLRVESYIIIAGTLIWAFGDYLVLELYISCAQC